MIAQFKQVLYNKNFSLQAQGKCDENDTLQKRIKVWPNVSNMGSLLPDDVYDFEYNVGLGYFVRGAEIIPEIEDLKKLLDLLKSK